MKRDKKLNDKLHKNDILSKEVNKRVRENEALLKEQKGFLLADENEKTLQIQQKDLQALLPEGNKYNIFDLDLNNGPYNCCYSNNGKWLLLCGIKGEISLIDWKAKVMPCSFNVKEKIRSLTFLHNETMYAISQRKYVYIYDNTGCELHCMRTLRDPLHLNFLRYHFLLVSSSKTGVLTYTDTSTGEIVTQHKTKSGPANSQSLDENTGVISLSYPNGQIHMHTPNLSKPAAIIQAHNSGVLDMKTYPRSMQFVTTGQDSKMNIWDLRMFKKIYSYYTPQPAAHLAISQSGVLGVGYGERVDLWKDWWKEKQVEPYVKHISLSHGIKNIIHTLNFPNYEDFLGIAHSNGFSSIVVPGSGESNFDNFESNPFENKKQRQEAEVHLLLDKLPSSMITLRNYTKIGLLDKAAPEILASERKQQILEIESRLKKKIKKKNKARGKSKIGSKMRKLDKEEKEADRRKNRDLMRKMAEDRLQDANVIEKEVDFLNQEIAGNFQPLKAYIDYTQGTNARKRKKLEE